MVSDGRAKLLPRGENEWSEVPGVAGRVKVRRKGV